MSADDGAGTREVARRLFAAEYDDATLSYSESDEERAPNYVVTPTGARVNRLFAVGVLTATESVNEDMLRARIVDPTGAFVAYAGQYQPDALAFFERATPPAFVALTAKARTFQPEDSEQVFTSARPETVTEVDADTRDRWTVSAAEATLRRVSLFDAALSSGLRGDELEAHLREHGVEEALAAGIPRAIDHYGTTTAYLDAVRRLALDALAVVAGEREEVRELSLAPDEGGAAALGEIPADLRAEGSIATPEATADAAPSEDTSTGEAADVARSATAGAAGDAASDAAAETTADTAGDRAADATDVATGDSSGGKTEATDEPAAAATDEPAAAATEEPTDSVEASADASAASEVAADADSDTRSDASASDDLGEFDDSLSGEPDTDEDDAGEPDTDEDEVGDPDTDTAEASESDTGAAEAKTPDEPELDDTADADATADDIDVAEDELYEFDEEEREAVREEHGLSFESGAEVDSPGEAGIETPDADDVEAESPAVDEPEPDSAEATPGDTAVEEPATDDAETAETDDAADAGDADADGSEPASEEELSDVVVDVMDDLDEGDGADREQVIAAVVRRSGADPGAVEDAIQKALMDGKCYEPGEGRLKAI